MANVAAALALPDDWKTLNSCDVLLICRDSDRSYTYRGQGYSPLIDSLAEKLRDAGLTTSSVAAPYSRIRGNGAFGNPVTLNRAAFLALIREGPPNQALSRQRHKHLSTLRQRVWRRVLQQAGPPRMVVGIQPEEALCRAAHEFNVEVYDLQHGSFGDEHAWYGSKSRSCVKASNLPNGFLCWDQRSAKVIEKWAVAKGITIRVVGNPWFSRFLAADAHDDLVVEARGQAKLASKTSPTILVSLQNGRHPSVGVIPAALEAVILATADRYQWLLRLHPAQLSGPEAQPLRRRLTDAFEGIGTVEWKRSSLLPLPILLGQCQLHITDDSSVTIEAGWFGVRTALFSREIRDGGRDQSLFLYERVVGIAECIETTEGAITGWIARSLAKGLATPTTPTDCVEMNRFIAGIVSAKQSS